MLRKGELEKAEEAFKSILMVFPGNARAKDGLQKIIETKSAEKTAVTVPETCLADENCVQKHYENREYDEAILKAGKMLFKDPSHAKLWNIKGASHGKLGQLDEAIKCFEKVKEFSTLHASANNNIGSVLRQRNEHELALQYYQMALQESPKFFDAQKT